MCEALLDSQSEVTDRSRCVVDSYWGHSILIIGIYRFCWKYIEFFRLWDILVTNNIYPYLVLVIFSLVYFEAFAIQRFLPL
jgi:hypothetical protein